MLSSDSDKPSPGSPATALEGQSCSRGKTFYSFDVTIKQHYGGKQLWLEQWLLRMGPRSSLCAFLPFKLEGVSLLGDAGILSSPSPACT